jgi:hypothetical protein
MKKIFENFEVNDLVDICKPKFEVDMYRSSAGRDDKNCVISIGIRDKQAASDLVEFIKSGYDYVLDSDFIQDDYGINNFLVFIELQRRTILYEQIEHILKDLTGATGIKFSKWTFKFMKEKTYVPFTQENFNKIVPLSPLKYRRLYEKPIQDLKIAAGLPVTTPEVDNEENKNLQKLAGLI